MGVPAMQRYPLLKSIHRSPAFSDNCWQTQNYDGVHGGCDLYPSRSGLEGEPIFSAWPGRVMWIDRVGHNTPGHWGRDYGNRLLLRHYSRHRHSNGVTHAHLWYSFHAHLRGLPRFAQNEVVDISHALGYVGDTGRSEAPHDHFAVQLDPGYKVGIVNPAGLLRRAIELELRRAA